MGITEEQRQRAEANRLAALEKRKRAAEAAAEGGRPDPWRLFRCRKIPSPPLAPVTPTATHELQSLPPPPLAVKVSPPGANIPLAPVANPIQPPVVESVTKPVVGFRAVLEVCSPDEFSIIPKPVTDFQYPGAKECFRMIEDCLSLVPFRCFESQIGRKNVYKMGDYETVSGFLRKINGLKLEEIPYKTRMVVEKFCISLGHHWIPCMPHHLADNDVEQLVQGLPARIRDGLLPFQLEGVRYGLQRGGRCLIADEMGLGKTLQAIAIASCFMNEGPILVVCPAVLRYSWAEEIECWLTSCLPSDIHLVFGHQNNLDHLEKPPKVVVISYTMLHRLRNSMLSRQWAVMIVDESHTLRTTKKKAESGETETVLDIAKKIKHIILLSGTPSMSRPFDIFHQINMLWPALLGNDKYEFANNYCAAQVVRTCHGKLYKDFSKGIRLEELNILLGQTLMIRRLKEHVMKQLPPKRRQILRVKLKGPDIVLAAASVAKDVSRDVECQVEPIVHCQNPLVPSDPSGEGCSISKTNSKGHSPQSAKYLNDHELGVAKLSAFREWIWNHYMFIDTESAGNLDNGPVGLPSQKMIVFAHHIKVLDGIQEIICEKGIQFVRIDGSTSARDRQAAVETFRSSIEVKIVIIGITAGGVGLDFSSAQSVVFVEMPKSASEMLQAEDRAHRRGQTNALNIYVFCAVGTSDEFRWQQLNRSLYRVSSMTNGKLNAIKELEVESVLQLSSSKSSVRCAIEDDGLSKVHMHSGTSNSCGYDDNSRKYENALENGLSVLEKNDEDNSHFVRGIDEPLGSNIPIDGENLELQSPGFRKYKDYLNKDLSCESRITIGGEEIQLPIQEDSLRFEVSQYTGRVHLYLCTISTNSRPKPLFENFKPEDLEAIHLISSNFVKRGFLQLVKKIPSLLAVLLSFVKEWNDMRAVERNKLLGKTLQLPLQLELCYLRESNNHGTGGLLKGGSYKRVTSFSDMNMKIPPNAIWKTVALSGRYTKKKEYIQSWNQTNEPLCKLCQNPCKGKLAKNPEYLEDLFCKLSCYQEYRVRSSQGSLREVLFQIEHGICANCKLDCHHLVRHIKPLSSEKRREYIKQVAPRVAGKKKLLEKLVLEPAEGNAWHADHIIPVYKGGGECQLENMRTLCVACHADVTAAQRAERRLTEKRSKEKLKELLKDLRSNNKDSESSGHSYDNKQATDKEMMDDDELLVKVPGSAYSCNDN